MALKCFSDNSMHIYKSLVYRVARTKCSAYALTLLIVAMLASCSDKSSKPLRTATVTIEPLRYIAEQIAGDRFHVVTMVPSGSNPEMYEPSARQMMELAHSDLYIKVGEIGFERTWMKKLKENAPKTVFVDSSEGVEMLQTIHGVPDPHVWMSVANAKTMARNICKALVEVSPADSAYFNGNLKQFIAHADNVDASIRSTLSEGKSRSFLIYHPILTYFARDYGLRQLPMEEEGKEPSAAQLRNVIAMAKAAAVKTFFVQREFANRNIDVVAGETKAQTTEIDPLGYQWDEVMMDVATKLK